MKIKIIISITMASGLAGMSKEETDSKPCSNLKLVQYASIIKNKMYDFKTDLNRTDKSGTIELMHLEILDPDKNQTCTGLFLECMRNVPCAIHLPFGRWQFARPYKDTGNHAEKLMKLLIDEFQLEFEEKYQASITCFDSKRVIQEPICIWTIRKVGQDLLEKGAYKGETEYMDAKHAKAAWKALFTQ